MSSRPLRARLHLALGSLVALQVLGTVLGFASWGAVRAAGAAEEQLALQRDALARLATAARELYVHQAHTLIERGPGHLDHLAETQGEVDARFAAVHGMMVPEHAGLDPVRHAIAQSNSWFATTVSPLARAGSIDQATAVSLHETAERHAGDVERAIGSVARMLDAAQADQRERIARATARAWVAVGFLTIGGGLAAGLVVRRLSQAILRPIAALQASATAFGEGGPHVPPAPEGDDELGRLGRAFNRMVEAVRGAERRRLETERLAALGQMSGAIAHELMNPLAVILADPAMKAPEVALSRAEAEHARRVVEGLLGFARPGEEPAETVDLAQAAERVRTRLFPIADLKDVALTVDAVPGATMVASPSAVRQVLDNLVRNAIDASHAGGRVEILVRAGPVIEVQDRGSGIPDEVRAHLYEPFVTGRPDGTGLGLAVSQRIARAHGGRIEHRVRPDGGTVAVWMVDARHA